jgi:hypothetical protein
VGIVNGTFAEAGALPGSAAGWTLVSRCQVERWAAFGSLPAVAFEDFERWSTRRLEFVPGQLVLMFFSPGGLGHEGFDRGWANDLYQTELSLARAVDARFAGVPEEPFNWIAHFIADWSSVQAIGGLFDGGAQGAEWFESGWSNNSFRSTWPFVPSVSATFSGVPVESFEGAWPHAATL